MESKTTTENDPLDLLWGAAEIAKTIKRSERETFHLLQTAKLPAKKVGKIWVASRRSLREALVA